MRTSRIRQVVPGRDGEARNSSAEAKTSAASPAESIRRDKESRTAGSSSTMQIVNDLRHGSGSKTSASRRDPDRHGAWSTPSFCSFLLDLGIAELRLGMQFGLDRRQRELQDGSPGLVRHRPETATMGDHDRAADRESHPHPVGLRREKRLEDALHGLGLKAMPRVADFDEDLVPLFPPGGDRQLPGRGAGLAHRIDRVEDEVQQELLKLDLVAV